MLVLELRTCRFYHGSGSNFKTKYLDSIKDGCNTKNLRMYEISTAKKNPVKIRKIDPDSQTCFNPQDDYEDFGDDDWTEAEGGSGSTDPKLEQKSFKEFSDTIAQTIKQFGGQV